MEQREFELALHVVCDSLLELRSPPVAKSIVDQIQLLHSAMRIQDGCVDELLKKNANQLR
jgi:hypothetical protein